MTMDRNTSRLILMIIVFTGLVSSFLILFAVLMPAGLSDDLRIQVQEMVLNIYIPLIATMGAFYFGQNPAHEDDKGRVPMGTFIFTLLLLGLWVWTTPVMLAYMRPISTVLQTIGTLYSAAQAIVAAASAYYFAKTPHMRK